MTFSERMKDLLEQGWDATKELAIKAGAKAQDLGEKGITMLDIKQLEYKAQKLMGQLGSQTYIAFTDLDQETIERDAVEFRTILEEIAKIKEQIEKRETELKNKG